MNLHTAWQFNSPKSQLDGFPQSSAYSCHGRPGASEELSLHLSCMASNQATAPLFMPCACVQVWAEPFCRRHYAGVLSGALLFRIFHLCLALGMALVVAFSTGGFWIVVVPAYTHPVVRYSNSALLLFQARQARLSCWAGQGTLFPKPRATAGDCVPPG